MSLSARQYAVAVSLSGLLFSACDSANKPVAAPQETPRAPGEFHAGLCINDKCGVVDSHGKLALPFDSEYDNVVPYVFEGRAVVAKDRLWQVLDLKKGPPLTPLGTEVQALTPGYYGFKRDGKLGVADAQLKELLPPRFDGLSVASEDDFIVHELADKSGVLDAHGKLITEALYDSIDTRHDSRERGHQVMAQRGEDSWIINLQDGSQRQVTYQDLGPMYDGHMVASAPGSGGTLRGLVDAKGNLVVPLKYPWLGDPGGGLVAFKESSSSACGYLDYTGKVVIEARFDACGAFGKKGAMASVEADINGKTQRKFGLLGHDGKWLLEPTYDYADDAILSMMGTQHLPGFANVAKAENLLDYRTGIFDLDQGRELIPPTYKAIGWLGPDRYLFSAARSPQLNFESMGSNNTVLAVGVMDTKGEVITKPSVYIEFRRERSGRYLLALDTARPAHLALLDLDGHELIGPFWQKHVIDDKLAVIFAYSVRYEIADEVRTLRAAYDLRGKPLFTVQRTPCGADQLLDGDGKPLWPLDVQPYCPAKQ